VKSALPPFQKHHRCSALCSLLVLPVLSTFTSFSVNSVEGLCTWNDSRIGLCLYNITLKFSGRSGVATQQYPPFVLLEFLSFVISQTALLDNHIDVPNEQFHVSVESKGQHRFLHFITRTFCKTLVECCYELRHIFLILISIFELLK